MIGEESSQSTPPPSRYGAFWAASVQTVPFPPVRVKPLSTAVESSSSMNRTTLAVSGCRGRLPSMTVRAMMDGSRASRYWLVTTIPLPPNRMFST
jgi:hypothetical protein